MRRRFPAVLGAATLVAATLVAAALLSVVPIARASFEIRPGAPGGSPLLPFGPQGLFGFADPSGLSSLGDPGDRGWRLGLLHLRPYGLAGLSVEGVALQRRSDRRSCGVRLSHLHVEGYGEWMTEADLTMESGLSLTASGLFRRPGSQVQRVWGIRPSSLFTLSGGWERAWGRRFRARFRIRDALRSGGAEKLGIAAVPGLELEFGPLPDWEFHLSRYWIADPGGRFSGRAGRDRAGLSWRPHPAFRIGWEWGTDPRSTNAWIDFRLARGRLLFWSAEVGRGLPTTTGVAVALDLRSVTKKPGTPRPSPGASRGRSRSFGDLHRRSTVSEPDPFWWVEDTAPVDSFWAVGDSLESEIGLWKEKIRPGLKAVSQERPRHRTGPGGPQQGGGGLELPVRLGDLTYDQVGTISGLSPDEILRLWSHLSRPDLRRLTDFSEAPPDLRRSILELVPYLTDRWPSGSTSGGQHLPAGVQTGRVRVSHVRTSGQGAGRVRSAVLWHWNREGIGMAGSLRHRRQEPLKASRWQFRFEAPRLGLAIGRSGRVLRWGLGLLAPAESIRLRRTSRSDPETTVEPVRFPSSLGGERETIGLGVRIRPWLQLLAVREGENRALAMRGTVGPGWGFGILRRGEGARPGPIGAWLRRSGDRDEVAVELATAPDRGLAGGLSWSRGVEPVSRARLWWNLRLVESLGRHESIPALSARSTGGAGLLFGSSRPILYQRRIRVGANWNRQSLWYNSEWKRTGTPGIPSEGSAVSRSAQFRAAGRVPRWFEWGGRLAQTTRRSRRSGEYGFEPESVYRSVRSRSRFTIQRGLGPASSDPEAPSWGLEVGKETLETRSTAGTVKRSAGWWTGLWRSGGTPWDATWSAGILQLALEDRASLGLSPSWVGGRRSSLRAPGLWGAGKARFQLGPGRLHLRWIWPLLTDPEMDSRSSWELSAEMSGGGK